MALLGFRYFNRVDVAGGFLAVTGVGVEIPAEDDPFAVGRESEVGLNAGFLAVTVFGHVHKTLGFEIAGFNQLLLVTVGMPRTPVG